MHDTVLVAAAFVLFIIAVFNPRDVKLNLVAAGLACWMASVLF